MAVSINGTSGLTGVAAIDSVSSTELGYLDGVTSAIQTQINAKLTEALTWTTYTPTWTATGGTPSIGNGTLTGKYIRIGKLLHFKIELTFGSTTSVGTTTVWELGTPVSVVADNSPMPIWILDSGTAEHLGVANAIATTYVRPMVAGNYLSYNSPFTWTTSDRLRIQGTLEAS